MKKNKLELLLLFAIITISATLFMAARGAAVNVDVADRYFWFIDAEILGGIGLAILESLALWHIAGAWYKLERDKIEWKVLGVIMVLLFWMIPIVSTPAIIAIQYSVEITQALRWSHLLNNHLSWIWTFVLTSVPSLMAFSIGIAGSIYRALPDTEQEEEKLSDEERILKTMLSIGTLDPFVLSEHSNVTMSKVDETVGKLQSLLNWNGAK